LRGIALTGSRAQAVAAVRRRFGSAERRAAPRTYTYAGGYVEDQWELSSGSGGTNLETFAVLSRHGRVVQLRVYTSKPEGSAGGQTFAQLLRRYDLKKRNYVFLEPEGGGGYAGFYYDDVKRGVCFTRGLQDVFLLTYRPDGIIVHRPGAAAVPIEEGLRGKADQGPHTRAYANEAEARRAERKNR
jgi:hypothetical protein